MRLYLAVAVLVLAFVAYADAQETFQEKFTKFGEKVSDITKSLAEKATTTLQDIHNSPFATSTRNWFEEQLGRLKTKVEEVTQ